MVACIAKVLRVSEGNKVSRLFSLAAALALALPLSAQAAMINGQLDISGLLNRDNSTFTPTGQIDFVGTGIALQATDDFAGSITPFVTMFTLYDISFAAPGLIYQGGGFSFTASAFRNFDNAFPGRSFVADGTLTAAGFDATPGVFALSTQSTGLPNERVTVSFSSDTNASPAPVPVPAAGFLLLGGLGMLAAARRAKAT